MVGLAGIAGLGGVGAGLAGGVGYGFGLRYGFEHLFPAFDKSGDPFDAVELAAQDLDQLLNGVLSGITETFAGATQPNTTVGEDVTVVPSGPIIDEAERPLHLDDLTTVTDPQPDPDPVRSFNFSYLNHYGQRNEVQINNKPLSFWLDKWDDYEGWVEYNSGRVESNDTLFHRNQLQQSVRALSAFKIEFYNQYNSYPESYRPRNPNPPF